MCNEIALPARYGPGAGLVPFIVFSAHADAQSSYPAQESNFAVEGSPERASVSLPLATRRTWSSTCATAKRQISESKMGHGSGERLEAGIEGEGGR